MAHVGCDLGPVLQRCTELLAWHRCGMILGLAWRAARVTVLGGQACLQDTGSLGTLGSR